MGKLRVHIKARDDEGWFFYINNCNIYDYNDFNAIYAYCCYYTYRYVRDGYVDGDFNNVCDYQVYKLNVSVVDKHDFFVCIISIVSIARDDEFNADLK